MPRGPAGGPTRALERARADRGQLLVAGVDEVGRGSLAGPVVAGAVVLGWGAASDDASALRDPVDDDPVLACVRDSKQLAARERARLAVHLERRTWWAVGAASPAEIDALGIARATWWAMRRAVATLTCVPDVVVVDGWPVPPLGAREQMALVGADRTVWAVAAASIVAKVRRDALMVRLDEALPGYGFARHKGYGTAAHRDAIARLGPTVHHRLSWRLLGEARAEGGHDAYDATAGSPDDAGR